MPEIAEVARVVHFLRRSLVGKKISTVLAENDDNVFGKVGTSGQEFEKALKDRTILDAGSQGKYFWLILDRPPHPVMHLGMTGWIHIRGERTAYTNYYKKMKPEKHEEWPPKYWKFHLETEGKPKVQAAYTDPRRFGRIRLVDCPGEDIRKHSPLVENGPDPVVDYPDIFTEDYLRQKMRSRHVPIKALILDQAMISGIGNWVGDEVLYHARLHPEQYCDEFDDDQIKRLYESIRYVCQEAVDKLGDSDQFPDDWLFSHRWGKSKNHASSSLPNGEKLAFLKVGGRTSCYAPNLQKKTGHLAPGIKEEQPLDERADAEPRKMAKLEKSAGTEANGDKKPPSEKREIEEDKPMDKSKPSPPEPANKKIKTEGTTQLPSRRRSERLRLRA